MATGHVQEENFSVCFSLCSFKFLNPKLFGWEEMENHLHTTISLRNNMTISEDDRISDKSFPGPAPTSQSPPPETNCVPFHDLIPLKWPETIYSFQPNLPGLRYCVSMCYALPHSTLFIKLIGSRIYCKASRRALWTITFSTFKSGQESFQCQLYWTKDWALPS